jgi:hypothetical protein
LETMLVKLTAVVKANGQWRKPGESVELPETEARRLIGIEAAKATGAEPPVVPPVNAEVEAMRAELARLQEFERQQLAADAAAKAQAEKEESDRKSAETAVEKGKGKTAAKGDADGSADGK